MPIESLKKGTGKPYTTSNGAEMKRLAAAWSCVALVGSVWAQLPNEEAWQRPLTFRHAAAPVARLVEEIGKQTGLPLKGSPSMWQEIVLLDVADQPLRVVLEKVADVTSGEWRTMDGAYILTRDSRAAARDEKEGLALRVQKIRDEFAKLKKLSEERFEPGKMRDERAALEQQGGRGGYPPDAWERFAKINAQMPDQRLAARIITLLNPTELAAIEPGARLVFSDSPNRVQRPIRGVHGPVSQFLAEAREWAAQGPPQSGDGDHIDVDSAMPIPTEMPARVLVAVTRQYESFGGLSINIMLVDRRGRIVGRGSKTILAPESESMVDFIAPGVALSGPCVQEELKSSEGKLAFKKDSNIEMSEESNLVMAHIRSRWSGGAGASGQVDEAFESRLLQPELYEPLATVPSDALFSVAKRLGRNIVAVLPDSLWYVAFEGGATTVNGFLATVQDREVMTFERDDTWLTARPVWVAEVRKERTDRSVVGRFARQVRKVGNVRLDDVAEFAAGFETPPYAGIGLYTLMLVLNDRLDVMGSGSWDAMALYGRLSRDQRRQLATGERLPLSSLSKRQLDVVARMVYGAEGRIDFEEVEGAPPPAEPMDEIYYDTLDSEPTEVLPNGLPPNGFIQIAVTNQDTFLTRAVGEDGREAIYPSDVMALAWSQFAKERPDLFPWASSMPTGEKFQLGATTVLDIKIRFTQRHSLQEQLRDTVVPENAPWMSFEQLPQAVKQKIAEQVAQLRKSYEGVKAGDIVGDGSPPPPR